MGHNLRGFDEGFYNNGSNVGVYDKLGCEQDLYSLNLISGELLHEIL